MTLRDFQAKAKALAEAMNVEDFYIQALIWANSDTTKYSVTFYDCPKKGINTSADGKTPDEALNMILFKVKNTEAPLPDIEI